MSLDLYIYSAISELIDGPRNESEIRSFGSLRDRHELLITSKGPFRRLYRVNGELEYPDSVVTKTRVPRGYYVVPNPT